MQAAILRQAMLRFARHRSSNALMVVALGVSLGAMVCTALFAQLLISGALPYPQSDRLFVAELRLSGPYEGEGGQQISYPAIELLQREAHEVLEPAVMLDHRRDLLLSHPAQPLLSVTYVSPGYAELFGPPMALGRFPVADQAHEAVISYATWTRLFEQRADVIGMSLLTAVGSFEVVGVTAARYIEPELHGPGHRTELWLPWLANPTPRLWGWTARTDTLQLVGRLATKLDVEPAAARLTERFDRGWREATGASVNPPVGEAPRVELTAAGRAIAGSGRALAPLLVAGTLGLILITLTNSAHVIVARVAERRHEFSIQRALGARSPRLFLAVLVDTLALLLPAGVLALAVVWIGFALMQTQLAHLLPRLDELTVDWKALALSVGGALLIGLALAGVAFVACIRETRTGLQSCGRSVGASALSRRLRTALMNTQVGLAGLLIAANLGLFREATRVLAEPAVDLDGSASLYLYQRPASTGSDVPAAQQFDEVRRRLAELPGVEQVSQSHSPLQDFIRTAVVSDRSAAQVPVGLKRFDSAYLELTGQTLAMGRGFSAEDIEQGAPVALVNAALARVLAHDGDVLGTRLTREGGAPHTVIGVVEDLRYPGGSAADLHVYLPASPAGSNFVLRFRPGQAMTREQLVALVEALNPGLGVFLYDDLSVQKANILLPRRIIAAVTAVISLVVIVSAGLGLHGMVGHAAGHMRGEIGARLAFGARAHHIVLALASRQSSGFVIGAASSAVAALLLSGLMPALGAAALGWHWMDVAAALSLLGVLALLACHLSVRPLLTLPPAQVLRSAGFQT